MRRARFTWVVVVVAADCLTTIAWVPHRALHNICEPTTDSVALRAQPWKQVQSKNQNFTRLFFSSLVCCEITHSEENIFIFKIYYFFFSIIQKRISTNSVWRVKSITWCRFRNARIAYASVFLFSGCAETKFIIRFELGIIKLKFGMPANKCKIFTRIIIVVSEKESMSNWRCLTATRRNNINCRCRKIISTFLGRFFLFVQNVIWLFFFVFLSFFPSSVCSFDHLIFKLISFFFLLLFSFFGDIFCFV